MDESQTAGHHEANASDVNAMPLRLSNPERATLAEIGKRLGRKVLREAACPFRDAKGGS